MLSKKQNILVAALQLFSAEDYHGVSTNKIAKAAGVSEGLIFKHFTNKEGLLQAIVDEGEQRIALMFSSLLKETHPQSILDMYISAPFEVQENEYDFWRLQFKLKWHDKYYNPKKLDNIKSKITYAFEELGYAFPKEEAEALIFLIESISIGILRDGKAKHNHQKAFLLKKYKQQNQDIHDNS